jgi:hypothetical protein
MKQRLASIRLIVLLLLGLTGKAVAQTPEDLQNIMPQIPEWTLTPTPEVFNRDNLYERINGAAPLYLENNFQEMSSIEYTTPQNGGQYITLQIYRHATPEDAFGMYASERSTDMTFYNHIGAEAQGDDYGLYFYIASLYIKISFSDATPYLQKTGLEIAKKISRRIDPDADYPPAFAAFPAEGKIPHTAAYITQNYIGHQFLKPAYVTDYEQEGRKFQLFLINAPSPDEARQILGQYYRFTKQTDPLAEGPLLVRDPYNGNIPIVWKGRQILGAFDASGKDFPPSIYQLLSKTEN